MSDDSFDQLKLRVEELRPSSIIDVAPRRSADPRESVDLFVTSLGFTGIGEGWKPLSQDEAASLLFRVLERNQAFSNSFEMEAEDATSLVVDFMKCAGPADFFTNGSFEEFGWGGHRVTGATCETGVIWVNKKTVGWLWVCDED